MTEASPCTHLTSDCAIDVPKGSVGHALPNTECRVIDVATGNDLGPVNTGSRGGLLPLPNLGAYVPSKFALVAYTEMLHAELACESLQSASPY